MEAKKEVKKTATTAKKTNTATKTAPKTTAKTTAKSATKSAEVKAVKEIKAEAVNEVKAEVKKVEPKKSTKKTGPMLKITLQKSPIACLKKQKDTIKALGLKKIRSTSVLPDNACTRGMIFVVKHMVTVEEIK